MMTSDPIRRIGKNYDKLRQDIKRSNPLLKNVPMKEIDNFIAMEIWDNYDMIFGKGDKRDKKKK